MPPRHRIRTILDDAELLGSFDEPSRVLPAMAETITKNDSGREQSRPLRGSERGPVALGRILLVRPRADLGSKYQLEYGHHQRPAESDAAREPGFAADVAGIGRANDSRD